MINRPKGKASDRREKEAMTFDLLPTVITALIAFDVLSGSKKSKKLVDLDDQSLRCRTT